MQIVFKFHLKMRWNNLNFLLLQLLSILASVHCIKKHDLHSFSEVLNSGINNDTDPCNDFYQYTCGKWIERNKKPDIFEMWNVDVMIEFTGVKMIKEILENPNIDESNKELSIEKKFYEACMDEDYSRNEGEKLLKNILVGTPRSSWQDAVQYYASFSAFDLFHIRLTESNYLKIERPFFSESNKGPFLDNSYKIFNRVFTLLTYIDMPQRINGLNESIDFIESINKITNINEEDIQTVSILQLQQLYDTHCPTNKTKMEWLQFFENLTNGTSVVFTKHDQLNVDVKYLKGFCELLSKTPEHAIVTYLQYNFMFNKDTIPYFKIDENEISYIKRYIRCIGNLKITEGINKEIMKLHVSEKTKDRVHEMFNNIKKEIIKEVENSWLEHDVPQKNQNIVHKMINNIKSGMRKEIKDSWLVRNVKEALLDRARRIRYKYRIISDPFKITLGKKVTYKQFEVGRVALQNELNLKRAQIMNIIQVYKEKHKLYREKRSTDVNACYLLATNEIFIGVVNTIPPYFYENAPIGFNYGRLGFTIGHEMSHAFLFEILQTVMDCFPNEQLREGMKSMLEGRKNCFVNEFNRFGIDGLRTLDENVADTQGLKLAWRAMNAVIKNKERKYLGLRNFKYSKQKKLFFLSFANQWCSNPEYREDNAVDDHAPHVIRTLGTLKNMNEFAKTFGCTDEAMNPITKCDWWA